MEITNVTINPALVKENGFLAYAHVTFDNCFCVTGFRLFFTSNGYELFVPAKKMRSGERLILADSLTAEMKHRIEAAVIAEYEKFSGEKLSSQTPESARRNPPRNSTTEVGDSVEIDHKLHHIIVEPWQESKTKRWKAQVAIFLPSSASGSHPIERPEFDQQFASEHESESAAIMFARDWIDAGKPNLISQD